MYVLKLRVRRQPDSVLAERSPVMREVGGSMLGRVKQIRGTDQLAGSESR